MKEYKLIGFLNMYGVVPDFVYPIFQYEKQLYFQNGDGDNIEEFVPVKESVYDKIKYVKNIKNLQSENDIYLNLFSKPICAFEISEMQIVYGTSERMIDFFEDYVPQNAILREEIDDFKKEVELSLKEKVSSIKEIRYYGTGKRKTSVAKVYVVPGNGKITINKRDIDDYFGLQTLKVIVRQPLIATGTVDKFDIFASVHGGGYTGQAGALRHGIARALSSVGSTYRPILKKAGYLTRDSRTKERKKYGLKAARRAPQFSKR